MQSFFKSWRFRIIAVVALLVIGLMLGTATYGGFTWYPGDAVSFIVTPAERVSATISNAVTDFLASFTTYSQVKSENEKLHKQIQQMTSKVVDYDRLQQENEQYKEYLGLKQEHTDFKFVSGMVIARDTGQWYSNFTLDKGSLDAVQVGDPVITADGLVGVVSRVLSTSSTVTTILDPSVHVGAIISHTGDVCIAQGTSDLMLKSELNVTNIKRDSLVTQGDIAITSGIGGVYPKGLRIATVTGITIDKTKLKTAVAVPMTDISRIRNAFIITDFTGKETDLDS